MNDIDLSILLIFAFLGMLLNAALGIQSARVDGEKFKKGKFLASVGRGIFTVVIAAIAFPTVFPGAIGVLHYLTAFLLGAGVDTVGHGLSTATRISEKIP